MQVRNELDRHLREAIASDPLGALREIAALKLVVAEYERQAVMAAIAQSTWRSVGDALGVTKQAAFQRFGKDWLAGRRAALGGASPGWRDEVRQRLAGR